MKLAIADPPYLGVAATWYGNGPPAHSRRTTLNTPTRKADNHPDAHLWDDPDQHRQLLAQLQQDYDGYAVAMKPASLWRYLQWCSPTDHRIAAWVKTSSMPNASRPISSWEPVLLRVPDGRRKAHQRPLPVHDWIATAGPSRASTYVGQKPPAWTRWVLTMLGYDPDVDTVDDLFPGSGAVTNEIAQGVLL